MDETPVWFDNPSKYTITKRGTKHVSQRASSNDKKRITVVLACQSDGTKLPPTVILKDRYSGPVPQGMRVLRQSKAWMNSTLMVEWINSASLVGKHLILDSFSGHKSTPVLDQLASVDHSFIPPRCTSECQPLDVGVNKPFKDRLRSYWNDYISQGILTKYGNYLSVSTKELLRWIQNAWDSISEECIRNSFKKALAL
jgi:hypothetical protein